jgi:hypothetical protein
MSLEEVKDIQVMESEISTAKRPRGRPRKTITEEDKIKKKQYNIEALRKLREEKPEKIKEYTKKWYENNKEKVLKKYQDEKEMRDIYRQIKQGKIQVVKCS